MLEECMQGLNLKDGGVYFDGTVGGAGHSFEILKRTAPTGRLIATDLDDDAISAAERRLSVFEGRFKIYKSDYKDFKKVLTEAEINSLDGAILDFGVFLYETKCAAGYENEPSAKSYCGNSDKRIFPK